MSPRVKRAAIVILKIAVLAAILDYARRQSQSTDEIALPAETSAGAAVLAERGAALGERGPHAAFVLPGAEGRAVRVAPGARLPVVEKVRAVGGTGAVFRARTPDGALVDIAETDVQGAPGAAKTAPFTLLPSWRTMFASLDAQKLVWAVLAFGPALFLMAIRLQVLLVASGVRVPFFTLVRLHYMGFFFNSFMPGGAGGDIIKAVYLLRHSTEKETAATMIFIDRVIGLLGLLLLGGTVVLFTRIEGVGFEIAAVSLVLGLGSMLFFSAWFRHLVRYDAIISRLPRAAIFKKVDNALLSLRDKKGAVAMALGITLVLQLLEVFGLYLAGQALGLTGATFAHYVAFVPIGYLANSIPLSFGGVGLMEGAFLKLFRDAGIATAAQGFMLGVLARIIVLIWSLLGALSALFPPTRPADVVDQVRTAEATSGGGV